MQLGPPTDVSVKELLETYTVRREHLSKYRGEHARNLHRDVAHLCEQLEATASSQCELRIIRT